MLENTEGTIINGQSWETGTQDEDKQTKTQHNMCRISLHVY